MSCLQQPVLVAAQSGVATTPLLLGECQGDYANIRDDNHYTAGIPLEHYLSVWADIGLDNGLYLLWVKLLSWILVTSHYCILVNNTLDYFPQFYDFIQKIFQHVASRLFFWQSLGKGRAVPVKYSRERWCYKRPDYYDNPLYNYIYPPHGKSFCEIYILNLATLM